MLPPKQRAAFTLIEILTAVGIFAIMVAVLMQMLGGTLWMTRFSHGCIDAAQGSRAAVDSLRDDLNHIVTVGGSSLLAKYDTDGNIRFAFLTQSRSPSGNAGARLVAVEYHLDGGDLVRSLTPVPWNSTNLISDTMLSLPENNNPTTQSSVVASEVLRFDAVAVMDDGSTLPLTQNATWWVTSLSGQTLANGLRALILTSAPVDAANPRVRAIVVGIATLDDKNYRLSNAKQMGSGLGGMTKGKTPVDVWKATLVSPSFLNSYPKPAIAVLHMKQSFCLLK